MTHSCFRYSAEYLSRVHATAVRVLKSFLSDVDNVRTCALLETVAAVVSRLKRGHALSGCFALAFHMLHICLLYTNAHEIHNDAKVSGMGFGIRKMDAKYQRNALSAMRIHVTAAQLESPDMTKSKCQAKACSPQWCLEWQCPVHGKRFSSSKVGVCWL